MILIADSGSTKCDWILIDHFGEELQRIRTKGLNPLIVSEEEIRGIIYESKELLDNRELVREIYFYGAGCAGIANNVIKEVLSTVFANLVNLKVEEDIYAAVHATTKEPGIVCILGTGMNCCFYDGENVKQYNPSLGYVLADEGSGNYFGKKLLHSFFLKTMPKTLSDCFYKTFEPSLDNVLSEIYTGSEPNKYISSFATFIFQHRGEPFIEELLHFGIQDFLKNQLDIYKVELHKYPVHFVGSIAYEAQDIIRKCLREKGYEARSFVRRPIEALIANSFQNNIKN